MGLFKRCSHRISTQQLEVIAKMYPYDILCYGDLRPKLMAFLAEEFPGIDEETRIIEASQHNRAGRQWGIVLLQSPGESDWELAGHFGHYVWLFFPPKRFLNIEYLFLVLFGTSPVSWPGDSYPRPSIQEGNIRRLKDLPAFCSWLDNFDPWEEFLKTCRLHFGYLKKSA